MLLRLRLRLVNLLGLAIWLGLASSYAHYATLMRRAGETEPSAPRFLPARAEGKKGVLYHNRIGPSASTLYLANADGTNERPLFPDAGNNNNNNNNSSSTLARPKDYFATFSYDGQWITFTTERNGDGNSDVYRVRADGTGEPEPLVASPSCELAGVLSPDNRRVAYVSSANGYKSNIWVKDLATGEARNLTDVDGVRGNAPREPDAYMRPAWSPDGRWIAFSSDRLTPWFGHRESWEHAPSTSIYVVRPDGTDFRRVATAGLQRALGSPRWSPDSRRIVYYEADKDEAADGQWPDRLANISSQVVSVDVATGTDRVVHTEGLYLKLFPQYVDADTIGFLVKGGPYEGVNYTSSGNSTSAARQFSRYYLRSPAWSPDGKTVVYERPVLNRWQLEDPLQSWDPEWEYRFGDVMPALSSKGQVAFVEFWTGNNTLAVMRPDGTDKQVIFDPIASGLYDDPTWVFQRLQGPMQPTWSSDGEWVVFSQGLAFGGRSLPVAPGNQTRLYRVRADGTGLEALTDGTVNSGMPSLSPDGKEVVFREWGGPWGLKILNLETRAVRSLTSTEATGTGGTTDNMPGWSPDGSLILFTRRMNDTNFDVCTIRPDGSDLRVLTADSPSNDAHAVWTYDGRIAFNTGRFGFRDEAAIYDESFQPYGVLVVMDADGSNLQVMSDSMWEDAMPFFVPNEKLGLLSSADV